MMPAVAVVNAKEVTAEDAVASLDVDQCLVTPEPEAGPDGQEVQRLAQYRSAAHEGRDSDPDYLASRQRAAPTRAKAKSSAHFRASERCRLYATRSGRPTITNGKGSPLRKGSLGHARWGRPVMFEPSREDTADAASACSRVAVTGYLRNQVGWIGTAPFGTETLIASPQLPKTIVVVSWTTFTGSGVAVALTKMVSCNGGPPSKGSVIPL